MRKLASIRKIDKIKEHTNADTLELAIIGGWQVVVRKGEFKENDLVVFFEIDSWVPVSIAPFLAKDKPKFYSIDPSIIPPVEGEKLKTVKLRGELSQGLILPVSILNGVFNEDDDVTEVLGIQKWEAPIHASLRGTVKGSFPSFVKKTDQERVQNLKKEVFVNNKDTKYEVSIKIDGSSMTVGYNSTIDSPVFVCSRNMNLKLDNSNNSFIQIAMFLDLPNKLTQLQRNIAIQGELYGEGIQGNPEKIRGHKFLVFDIWDIDNQKYLSPKERQEIINQLGLESVPILHENVTLADLNIHSMEDILLFANGPSKNPDVNREGVVFKSMNGEFSFKSISNLYLLKNK